MIDLKDRRIALIGGAGFIGHHLALALKQLGAEVSIIDGLQVNNLVAIAANENNIPNQDMYLQLINQRLDLLRHAGIRLYVQDARDYNSMTRIMDKLKPQTVVQLAAIAHANRANKDPFSTFDHNLRTLENALDCAKGLAEHFIYFSSSMVYGNFETGTVDEDTVCHPLGIYGALKYSRRTHDHSLQPGVRPALHHRAPLGTLRRALREPAGGPGVH